MSRKLKAGALIGLGAVLALVVAVAVFSAARSRSFRARYEAEKGALLQRGRSAAAPVVDPAAVASLPPPVRRYVELAGVAGSPSPRVATLVQRGAIRAAADAPWMPFEAEQAYAFGPAGFVWFADARLGPLLHVLARDRFVDGAGNMLIRLLGAFTVADGKGPEIDQGAGLRYWGEAICFPEVVLDPRLRWEPIDDRRARMLVEQGSLKLTATVEFDAEGMPTAVHAERYRDVKGKGVLTRWSGHSREWKALGGRRFPTRWESVWHLDGGDLTAVTMEVLSVRAE